MLLKDQILKAGRTNLSLNVSVFLSGNVNNACRSEFLMDHFLASLVLADPKILRGSIDLLDLPRW